MLKMRVIPVLLLHNRGVVKTTNYKDPVYIGDPINIVKIFNEKEVDELVIFDIDASKEAKEPDYSLITAFATECFMPVCYGGGVTNLEQMRKIFSLGVEKISLNFATMSGIDLVKDAVQSFGAQSVIITVDVKKNILGKYKLYNHGRNRLEKIDIEEVVSIINDLGVGELIVNNVDRDGTQVGYDIDLIKKISSMTTIPVVTCGGASSLSSFSEARTEAGVSAVAAGSMFVFQGRHKAVLISYPKYDVLKQVFGEE